MQTTRPHIYTQPTKDHMQMDTPSHGGFGSGMPTAYRTTWWIPHARVSILEVHGGDDHPNLLGHCAFEPSSVVLWYVISVWYRPLPLILSTGRITKSNGSIWAPQQEADCVVWDCASWPERGSAGVPWHLHGSSAQRHANEIATI